MKKLLILFIVAFSLPVLGQQSFEGKSVNRGNIITTDSEIIEGQYIVFLKDSIEFYLENSQTRYVLGLNRVSEVLEYDGNYGTTGWILGGLGGCAIGVVVALGTEETENSGYIQTTTIQTWPIYLFALIGGVAGWLVGNGIEDWNTVYSKSTAFLKNINIRQNNSGGLTVSYLVYF
jgi:predicted outer membrane lipoprotein